MGRFKFVHTADIHLGSFLHADGAESLPGLQELCREATYRAFENICRLAIQNKARFLLISGDLYDREARSVRANRFFADWCKRLADEGILTFVTAGNHDPVREYQELFALPQQVHLFSADRPEIIYISDEEGRNIAAVAGQSYRDKWEKSPLHLNYPKPEGDIFRIAMLHTQLESGKSSYIPSSAAELAECPDFDYWALGHIHKPQLIRNRHPVIAYPGSPQGRDFGEQDPGGCWLIEVDGREIVRMDYHITSPVVYRSLFIDIGCPELQQADSLDQLAEHMLSHAQNISDRELSDRETGESGVPEAYIVRWEIGGRGPLHYYLKNDLQGSGQELCRYMRDMLGNRTPFLWTDSVTVRTAGPVTDKVLERHPALRELLDQTVLSIQQDASVSKQFISQLGQAWDPDTDYEDRNDARLPLDDQTLGNIIEDASRLLLEGLSEGGEE